ncbi:MAG: preprotein translocase subunit Sec61beta [Euryarchaeota archaeon]|nr:preprotein translocase subunit Sec61beta [Euryarchaeota archaeon]
MAKKQSGGLISSAGLVNYYDSDNKRAIQINPYSVMAVAIICAVIIYIADVYQRSGF